MSNAPNTPTTNLRRWEVRYQDAMGWRSLGSCVTKREARLMRDDFCRRELGSKPKTWIVDLWETHEGKIVRPM